MRSIRLAILGESPCHDCYAACCRQNGHDFAALLQGEEVRKFRPFATKVPIRANGHVVVETVLPYRDGRCVFLGDDDRCTIYEDRPRPAAISSARGSTTKMASASTAPSCNEIHG